ncbi:MAG: hypothetical protein WAO09_03610 [Candidatus Dormiibacterota bacterium]|jgi:energy-converting hydrogenase Eha subunit A
MPRTPLWRSCSARSHGSQRCEHRGKAGRGGPPGPPALRRALPAVVVVLIYILLGIVAFWPGIPQLSGHVFARDIDYFEAVWFIGWVPHALSHGLNPFWTDALNAPFGVNLALNTEAPLLGFITAPVSLVFSPTVATNLLLLLGMPVSASAAYLVLRKWQLWRPAAALGGLMYGFSPYMVGQSLGHPQLMFQPLPPLIALVAVSILHGRGNPRRLGIWLGILVTAEYLVSPEVFASLAVFAALALACLAIRHPNRVGTTVRAVIRPVCIAAGVAAVLLAYPVGMLLAGPQHFSGSTLPLINPYHNDLLSFVVPGPMQRIDLGMGSLVKSVLSGNDVVEAGGYIGVPLLALGGYLFWQSRHRPRMQLTATLLVGAAILSLGPHLTVDGRTLPVRLPFDVLGHLPLLDDILPARFSFEVGAFMAAVIAFGLDDMRRAPVRHLSGDPPPQGQLRRRLSYVVAGLTLVFLIGTQLPNWPLGTPPVTASLQSSPLPASLVRAIPAGDPIALTYPYDTAGVTEPMVWQETDAYSFRILGGYAYIRGADGHGTTLAARMSPPGTQQFLTAQEGAVYLGQRLPLTPELVATTRATISTYDIRVVIVDRSFPGSGPVLKLFTEALGPPEATSGHYSLWAGWAGWAGSPGS